MALYSTKKNKKGNKVNLKGNKNPQEIFYESTQKLFQLLAHHPYFLEGVSKLRNKHKIHYQDITDIPEFLEWKRANTEKCSLLIQDENLYGLINDFKIPQELKKSAKNFAYDFILTNNLITNSMFETGLNIIKYSKKEKTLKLNEGSVYVEITPFTTERELKNGWDRIVGDRKEIRNYGIPKTQKIDERVWELYMEGYSTKEICQKIKGEFSRKSITYTDVIASKHRYKTALSKLRKI